jgi:hypothetical protein
VSSSTFRIPRMALVTLTLGVACGDDDGDRIDVSAQRRQSATEAYCNQAQECGELEQETVNACIEEYMDYVEGAIDADGEDCGDAMLDWVECYAKLSCESDDDCEELYDTMVKECPNVIAD